MTEAQLHRAVAEFLGWSCPHPWTTSPAGHFNSRIVGGILKGLGASPGWADIFIAVPRGGIHIELKTKKGVQSQAQKAFEVRIRRLIGHSYHVCRTVDDVEAALESRGVELRARVA